eukprot:gnl/Hemi2/2374_TR838_c0_g1_i1.p1 gnl/Hemi2/2374_TR838_c0_g1~~gnl/Hemi2/2374_TR838_c0_g1_i1.p1  ORF type:complete len:677 (-),score=236.63 gnl/Hemi2/2374_TR838_c0_g1_i1:105-2135(-)
MGGCCGRSAGNEPFVAGYAGFEDNTELEQEDADAPLFHGRRNALVQQLIALSDALRILAFEGRINAASMNAYVKEASEWLQVNLPEEFGTDLEIFLTPDLPGKAPVAPGGAADAPAASPAPDGAAAPVPNGEAKEVAPVSELAAKQALALRAIAGKAPMSSKSFIQLAWENGVVWSRLRNRHPDVDKVVWMALQETFFALITLSSTPETKQQLTLDNLKLAAPYTNPDLVQDGDVDKYLQSFWTELQQAAHADQGFVSKKDFLTFPRTEELAQIFFHDLIQLKEWTKDLDSPPEPKNKMLVWNDIFSLALNTCELLREGDKITLENGHAYMQKFVARIPKPVAAHVYKRIKRDLTDDVSFELTSQSQSFIDLFSTALTHLDCVESPWGLFFEAAIHEAVFSHITALRPPKPAAPAPTANGTADGQADPAANGAAPEEKEKAEALSFTDMLAYCQSIGSDDTDAANRMSLDRDVRAGTTPPQDGSVTFNSFVSPRTPALFPEVFAAIAQFAAALGLDAVPPMRLAPIVQRKSCERVAKRKSALASKSIAMRSRFVGRWVRDAAAVAADEDAHAVAAVVVQSTQDGLLEFKDGTTQEIEYELEPVPQADAAHLVWGQKGGEKRCHTVVNLVDNTLTMNRVLASKKETPTINEEGKLTFIRSAEPTAPATPAAEAPKQA